jgi:hypothetical protein
MPLAGGVSFHFIWPPDFPHKPRLLELKLEGFAKKTITEAVQDKKLFGLMDFSETVGNRKVETVGWWSLDRLR